MTGQLEGKVALVSGAARGQGRSHAVRMAEEGADIIAFDLCDQISSIQYPMATPDDLQETVAAVEATGRRIVARQADVRALDSVRAVVADGVAEFGRLDVIAANAGIASFAKNTWSITEDEWDDMIGVNLSGVWRTVAAAVPAMIDAGNGGSIVLTGSTGGLRGISMIAHYVAAKHGLVGLMRTLMNELAPHNIRVNVIHPTGVQTPMITNNYMGEFLGEYPDYAKYFVNALPVENIQPVDISNAIVYLSSEAGRYVTGVELPVDAGMSQRV